MAGTRLEIADGPVVSVKPSVRRAVSLVVATVTVRVPGDALAEMVIVAVRRVELVTVTELTEVPDARLTVVFP